jgi:hypothetical protein
LQEKRFTNYDEFFTFYLEQHASHTNRLLHACGTLLGITIVLVALATRHYFWALAWIPVSYGLAWIGHLLIEGNKPATFGHPWWSFISDFRMLALMIRKLGRSG